MHLKKKEQYVEKVQIHIRETKISWDNPFAASTGQRLYKIAREFNFSLSFFFLKNLRISELIKHRKYCYGVTKNTVTLNSRLPHTSTPIVCAAFSIHVIVTNAWTFLELDEFFRWTQA